jgi:hypothetical protein
MKVSSFFKKASIIILASLSLCGCFELGDFESDEEYFECFPSVELIDKNKSSDNYSVKDYFYTEEGINDYISNIPYAQYLYLAVQVNKDLLLDELLLSFCSQEDCKLEISVFISENIPSNIRGYDDPLYDENNEKINYDDPIEALDTKILYLNANKWTSSYLIDRSRNNYLSLSKGKYIILRFENNSFVGKEKSLTLSTFTTTNLLIRTQGS